MQYFARELQTLRWGFVAHWASNGAYTREISHANVYVVMRPPSYSRTTVKLVHKTLITMGFGWQLREANLTFPIWKTKVKYLHAPRKRVYKSSCSSFLLSVFLHLRYQYYFDDGNRALKEANHFISLGKGSENKTSEELPNHNFITTALIVQRDLIYILTCLPNQIKRKVFNTLTSDALKSTSPFTIPKIVKQMLGNPHHLQLSEISRSFKGIRCQTVVMDRRTDQLQPFKSRASN